MSGGHWDYQSSRLEYALLMIAEDETVIRRWPVIGELLKELGPVLARIEDDMDWDICGDTIIQDDAAWERDRIGEIVEAAKKADVKMKGEM